MAKRRKKRKATGAVHRAAVTLGKHSARKRKRRRRR